MSKSETHPAWIDELLKKYERVEEPDGARYVPLTPTAEKEWIDYLRTKAGAATPSKSTESTPAWITDLLKKFHRVEEPDGVKYEPLTPTAEKEWIDILRTEAEAATPSIWNNCVAILKIVVDLLLWGD